MKKMLINATQEEEIRIALIDKKKLYDLYIENYNYEYKKYNIYKGKVIRIEPSLEAAFIDYGYTKHGFLPIKEVYNSDLNNKINKNTKIKIKNLIKEGDEILVQVNKEERGNKGALLTTFISLTGTYLVLMINNPLIRGISKRIEGNDRVILKNIISKLNIDKNMGFIIRTSGIKKTLYDLQSDLNLKLNDWKNIQKFFLEYKSPSLIYKENNIIKKIFRDYLTPDIKEIIVDNIDFLNKSKNCLALIGRNDFLNRINLYSGNIPLFSFYKIESQIESAFKRKVRLPSGGSITIDSTEALTAIDINSSKNTKGIDIEETAYKTNLEAVEEISRQLRFRDLGGLVVIDFIDMNLSKNRIDIEKKLHSFINKDRSKIKIGKISKFGLLELSRQRINQSLNESNYNICVKCDGTGFIRNNKSLSLSILRLIEEESIKDDIQEIHVIVPIDIGTYLLNEKRTSINDIENRSLRQIRIVIIPSNQIEIPDYTILKIKFGGETSIISYLLPKTYEKNFSKNENIDFKYKLFDYISCINKNNSKIEYKIINSNKYTIIKNIILKIKNIIVNINNNIYKKIYFILSIKNYLIKIILNFLNK